MKRYGVPHAMQNIDIQNKAIQTRLDIYGVEYLTQNEEIKKRIMKTLQERYSVSHSSQIPDHFEKYRATSMKNWGTPYPSQSLFFHILYQSSGYKFYDMTIDNKLFQNLQGYEKFFLLSNDYDVKDIVHGETVPRINYILDNVHRVYHPDFYIPSQNKIIEVKSPYTFQIGYDKNMEKQQYALKNGYSFEFKIYDYKGTPMHHLANANPTRSLSMS